MSFEGLIIALTLLIVLVLWNAAPLLRSRRQTDTESTQQRERLLVHYERVLNNIRDLDEDRATGKIQPDDYAQDREQLVQRGIQILLALDALGSPTPAAPAVETRPGAEIERSVDQRIEAAVAAYRSKSTKQLAKS